MLYGEHQGCFNVTNTRIHLLVVICRYFGSSKYGKNTGRIRGLVSVYTQMYPAAHTPDRRNITSLTLENPPVQEYDDSVLRHHIPIHDTDRCYPYKLFLWIVARFDANIDREARTTPDASRNKTIGVPHKRTRIASLSSFEGAAMYQYEYFRRLNIDLFFQKRRHKRFKKTKRKTSR